MTADVQAPAPPAPPPATLRRAAGLVFFRLAPIRFKDRQARGQVLVRIREGHESPPFGAEAWKAGGGKWSYDFGGKWAGYGGRLTWEWL